MFRCHVISIAFFKHCFPIRFLQRFCPPQQVSGKHNTSKSLLMITESTDKRSEKIYQGSQREQQYTVIASKLTNKKHFNRNCVYQLNYMYDSRGDEYSRCVSFLECTKRYESMINLCFTTPATYIFTKFVPNKLNNYLRYATVALLT